MKIKKYDPYPSIITYIHHCHGRMGLESVRRKPLGIYRYACSQHSRHHTAAICTETQGKIPQRNEREKQNPLPARKYAERFGIIFSPLHNYGQIYF